MKILGVGIDIADIKRYANKDDLAKRVLHPIEYLEYLRAADKASYLASRFAVKESYVKASQNKTINYQKLCVKKNQQGMPLLYLDDQKLPAFVSLSHDDKAIAIVILYQD